MAQTFNYHSLPVEFESVSAVTATNSVDLGTVRTVGGEEYVYVYNAGPVSMNVGNLAVLSCNSGFSVTVSSITGFDMPFGFVKHANIPAASYGWLLARGFTTVTNGMVGTALALRDLIGIAADGKVQVYLTPTLCTGAPFGYVVSACASGGTGASQALAYIRTFGT